jgi:hypothetical protein
LPQSWPVRDLPDKQAYRSAYLGNDLSTDVPSLQLRKTSRYLFQVDHLLNHRVDLLLCNKSDHFLCHGRQVNLRFAIR